MCAFVAHGGSIAVLDTLRVSLVSGGVMLREHGAVQNVMVDRCPMSAALRCAYAATNES